MRIADAGRNLRHVFLHDMLLALRIGVSAEERRQPQRVRIAVDLAVAEGATPASDELGDVVDYGTVAQSVRAVAEMADMRLVETLAERIAEACLSDARVVSARVRVEKLDVFPEIGAAGVEIERVRRADHPPPQSFPRNSTS